ncbi:diacylglycerol O-acyltransferase [Synchytrium microbalum]|uniref:Diacylglycerol O-acyltransferase n=1 Tax=Synchytrium microbalum TaxID=1806994 RepID=A0A507C338_9FUNG|nr:diacylglycerol O-acyltransferase [Synchytrium microbalum]TPX33459.1 diacylglycerol O-acyltransferase [Synchytrium microbalum]
MAHKRIENHGKFAGYLTGIDASFLAIENADPETLMTIAGIYEFHQELDEEVLRKQLTDFAFQTERYTSVCVRGKSPISRPYWVDIGERFDIANHLVVKHIPNGTLRDIQDAAAHIVSQPFDMNNPLWHVTYFKTGNPHFSAMLIRTHHCVTDGQGSMRALITFLTSVDPILRSRRMSQLQYSAGKYAKKAHKETLGESLTTPIEHAWATLLAVLAFVYALFLYGSRSAQLLLNKRTGYLRKSKRALMESQLGVSTGIPLEEIKDVKDILQCTVNDVMVACTSAAFEQYLAGCDDLVDTHFTFMAPTSLRKKDDLHVSNESSAYLIRVPVMGDETVRRVHATRQTMNIAKKSPEQYLSYWFLQVAFYFPWMVPKAAFSQVDVIHGVITNVPGPSKPLSWAGKSIMNMYPIVCLPSTNSFGCALTSYNGSMTATVQMKLDEQSPRSAYGAGGAQAFADLIEVEFRKLQGIVTKPVSPGKELKVSISAKEE